MPGRHREPTIAFRPSAWEYAQIEKRAELSGLYKKDFIAKSCIYGSIIVTGTRENINRIVREMRIMEAVVSDISEQFSLGNIPMTDEPFNIMYDEFFAEKNYEKARETFNEIILLDCAIDSGFNASAKYLVQLQGIPFTTVTRSGSSLSEPRIRSLQSFYEYAKAHDIL